VEQDLFTAFELAHHGFVIEHGRVTISGETRAPLPRIPASDRLIWGSDRKFYDRSTKTPDIRALHPGPKSALSQASHATMLARSGFLEAATGIHSITSLAATSKPVGTVRPSALAVFKLRAVSYLVGASTGRSAGSARCCLPKLIDAVGAVRHETTSRDERAQRVSRGQSESGRQRIGSVRATPFGGRGVRRSQDIR
jgi:hypothetical protein